MIDHTLFFKLFQTDTSSKMYCKANTFVKISKKRIPEIIITRYKSSLHDHLTLNATVIRIEIEDF